MNGRWEAMWQSELSHFPGRIMIRNIGGGIVLDFARLSARLQLTSTVGLFQQLSQILINFILRPIFLAFEPEPVTRNFFKGARDDRF